MGGVPARGLRGIPPPSKTARDPEWLSIGDRLDPRRALPSRWHRCRPRDVGTDAGVTLLPRGQPAPRACKLQGWTLMCAGRRCPPLERSVARPRPTAAKEPAL